MRHTLRETWSGLRRNLSMTLAVIVTMWVSLSLFGASLLTMQQVDLMKGRWYDRIEISVFLCTADSGGNRSAGNCEPGQATTDAQRELIRTRLEANPEVLEVFYESQADAYEDFRETYRNSPIEDSLTVEQMQDSFRIKLRDPQNYAGVTAEARSLPGVQAVQDLHSVLDPLFAALNGLRWGTMGMSALLLIAAALQIGNTIRLSAFTRRREIGIMRLVGASNSYILLPFLLESLFAGVVGIVLAGATMAAAVKFAIIDKAQVSIQSLAWIGWPEAGIAMLGVAGVGILLSIVPTLIATRRYLKV